MEEAFSANRPVVLEAYTDPEVPPLPPHIKPSQAKAFVSALLKGDPESVDMIKQSWKDAIAEYTH